MKSLTGHHAGRYYCTSGCLSTGFCLLNNAAIAVIHATNSIGIINKPFVEFAGFLEALESDGAIPTAVAHHLRYLTAYASIHRFILPFNHLIYSSFHPSISSHLFIHPSIYPFIYSSIHPFIHKSIFSFIHPSIYSSFHSSTHLFIHLSTHFHPSIHPWFLFVTCVCVCFHCSWVRRLHLRSSG